MSRMQRMRKRERAYQAARGWLCRTGLARWIDFCWCEIILAASPLRAGSGWDVEDFYLAGAGPKDEAALRALAPERGADFPQRWAEGRRCFAAWLGRGHPRQCVGYLWATLGPTRLPGTRGWDWELPAGSAWLYDAYSHPLVLGTYPDLLRFARRQLAAEGVESVFAQIEFDNPHSRRVQRRLGAIPCGSLMSLRLGGLNARLERHSQSWRVYRNRTPVRLAAFRLTPAATVQPPSPPLASSTTSSHAQ